MNEEGKLPKAMKRLPATLPFLITVSNRLLILLIGLIWTNSLPGQVQNDVKKVLETRDFAAFKTFAEKLSNWENRITARWEILRDLATGFQEGVFTIEKIVPDNDNPNTRTVYTFKVAIIATKDQIAYYELSEKKYDTVGRKRKEYYHPIATFKDKILYENLKNSFKATFKTRLHENDLCKSGYTYGDLCDFAGIVPTGRQKIDEWVARKNKKKLLKWLTSANTEKQVYAVDGLYQLKQAGIKLTEEEINMITFVINKSGNMNTCSGCIYGKREISRVTQHFKQ